jgi:mono/diheme cytochrome c family protein
MKVANKADKLKFPFSIRQTLMFWNLFNLPGDAEKPDGARSEIWNRGRYLSDALAHCGECHTPRNLMMGMRQNAYLQGALLEGIVAPDITKAGLTQMGFDPLVLSAFMKSGISNNGAMANQMFEVVHFSTQYMSRDDLDALSAYLFDLDKIPDSATPPGQPKPIALASDVAASARTTYLAVCAGCHGSEGQGVPHVVVPLSTNISLRLTSARNLIRAVLDGIPAQHFPGLERMQSMPGFKAQLTDQQVVDLVNWLRASWGGREPQATLDEVHQIRQGPRAYLSRRHRFGCRTGWKGPARCDRVCAGNQHAGRAFCHNRRRINSLGQNHSRG